MYGCVAVHGAAGARASEQHAVTWRGVINSYYRNLISKNEQKTLTESRKIYNYSEWLFVTGKMYCGKLHLFTIKA